MTARKSLAAAKFAFLEAVACDPSLSLLDQRVSVLLICKYLNGKTGQAWPSAETLAEDLSTNERSVRRSLKRLSGKWWTKRTGGGRGQKSKYAPNWETVTDGSVFGAGETVTDGSPFIDKTVTERSENSDRSVPKTVTARPPEPIEEPIDEPFDWSRAHASLPAPNGSARAPRSDNHVQTPEPISTVVERHFPLLRRWPRTCPRTSVASAGA